MTGRALTAIAFATYLLGSRGVGDLYPWSTFDMYSHTPGGTSSRVLVLDGGETRDVADFRSWRCDGPIDLSPLRCEGIAWPFYHVPYVDAAAAALVREGGAGEPEGGERVEVQLVRRIWIFRKDGAARQEAPEVPAEVRNCPLHACTAVRAR